MLGGPCSMTEKKCVLRGFKVDGKIINENEISELKEIVSILNEFGESGTVDFIGHTDSNGTKKYNQKLSLIRARNVARLFREFGLKDAISIGKISGKGEEDPVDLNETDQGKYSNRRVEILFNNLKWKKFE
jgi:ompA/motB domain protein